MLCGISKSLLNTKVLGGSALTHITEHVKKMLQSNGASIKERVDLLHCFLRGSAHRDKEQGKSLATGYNIQKERRLS